MTTRLLHTIAACVILALACGCASPGRSGVLKNSIPFFDRDQIEALHSVAIPPFFGDKAGWRAAAAEQFSESRATMVSDTRLDQVLRLRKDISAIPIEKRPDAMARIGREAQADAVVNGLVLSHNERWEIVLQLVNSRDGRLLWWQALDAGSEQAALTKDERDRIMAMMLQPLIAHIAKGTNPSPTSGSDVDTKEKKPKPQKKPMGPEPSGDEYISPM